MAGQSAVDFHNHLIPGVDDGAEDVDDSRAALDALAADGVGTLVATPHFDGSLTADADAMAVRLAELDEGWAKLRDVAAAEFPELRVERGVELALVSPDPDLSDPRLRLAGGPFALVEFAMMNIPPRSTETLARIRQDGWKPIVAHPERYRGGEDRLRLLGSWREAGAFLQVNMGSLLGHYGPPARERAIMLLERGWVDFLCTDYHTRGESPVAECRRELLRNEAELQLRQLTVENPARMLEGEDPLPVEPLSASGSLWSRIARAFR